MNETSTTPAAFSMTAPLPGLAPEVAVSNDMVKRGLIIAPVLIAVCGFIWGMDGAWSCAYAIAIVLINFVLASGIVAVTAKISLQLMNGLLGGLDGVRFDRDEDLAAALGRKVDLAFENGVNCVICADANTLAGVPRRAALTADDVARNDVLAAEFLDAKTLRM